MRELDFIEGWWGIKPGTIEGGGPEIIEPDLYMASYIQALSVINGWCAGDGGSEIIERDFSFGGEG